MPLADLTAVSNLALDYLGEPYLTAYATDTTVAAQACRLHLPQCIETVLEGHVWSFATRCSQLTAAAVESTTAQIDVYPGGENNGILLFAQTPGPSGNEISLTIEAAGFYNEVQVSVSGSAITVVPALNLTISGSLFPSCEGPLIYVQSPISTLFPGKQQFSTDGLSTAAATGEWVEIYSRFLSVPADKTLAQIAPTAGYLATNSQSTASQILVYAAGATGALTLYWLYNDNGTARWVEASDGTMADQGATSIVAGKVIAPVRSPGVGFVGGFGETWQDAVDTEFLFYMLHYTAGVYDGGWKGLGTNFENVSWAALSGSSGTPAIGYGSSTAAEVIDVLTADSSAALLVTAVNSQGHDGTGTVSAVAATYLEGGSSTSTVYAPAYGSGFNLPADCLRVLKIDTADIDVPRNDFEIQGRYLLLAEELAEAPVIHYITSDPPVDEWPTTFTDAVAFLLASRIAPKVAKDIQLSADMLQKHEIALGKARSKDTRETRSKENFGPRHLAARSKLVRARYGNILPPY